MSSVVISGDTSGAVTLSAPAVAGTTTLTLPATSGTVLQSGTTVTEAQGGTGTTVGYYGFKNRLINSAMVIDQRNAGASVNAPTTTGYTLDRWYVNASQSSKLTIQQNAGSVTPPAGFTYYLGATSSSAYSITASDLFYVSQFIEGYNSADLAWGTANASSVTLSFKVYSSLTGTFGGSLQNSANARSYPFTYSIPTANTWTTISVTVAGDTSGTWLTTNGIGIRVFLGLGVGSTYSTTANAWAAGDFRSATGATSVVGTSGATFYITGVQLEKGSTATSFDYRPYGTELALCQRYYIKYSGNGTRFYGGRTESTSAAIWQCALPVEMRTTPTVTAIDVTNLAINDTSVQVACTSISTAYSSTRQIAQGFNCGTVTNIRYIFLTPTSGTAAVEASAEL
jgi:hypothetical protein